MRTKIINSLVLCSIILMCNNSFGQGPGVFNFANNFNCPVDVTIYAYDGECGSVTCDDDVGSIGSITVAAHSVVNIASGYTGNGDVWGRVVVDYFMQTTSAGSGDCNTSGYIACVNQDQVQWDSCNSAHIP